MLQKVNLASSLALFGDCWSAGQAAWPAICPRPESVLTRAQTGDQLSHPGRGGVDKALVNVQRHQDTPHSTKARALPCGLGAGQSAGQ